MEGIKIKIYKLLIGLGVFVCIIFLAGFIYTWIRTEAIKVDYPPTGDFIDVGEMQLHYLRKGSGFPVVMLHGRDGALQEFTYSIYDQIAEKYDAIAFDRPGYGYSSWGREEKLTTELQVRLIHEALETLKIEKPLMIGHSYGGAVTLQYLIDYPDEVSGAVLLSGVAYNDEKPDGAIYNIPNIPIIGPLLTHSLVMPIGSLLTSKIYSQAFAPAEAPKAYIDTIGSLYLRPEQFTDTAGELSVMQESVQKISPLYGDITVPITIFFGDSDNILDYETDGIRLMNALTHSDSKLILIENAGHKLHHSHSDQVLSEVEAIIQKTGDSTTP